MFSFSRPSPCVGFDLINSTSTGKSSCVAAGALIALEDSELARLAVFTKRTEYVKQQKVHLSNNSTSCIESKS